MISYAALGLLLAYATAVILWAPTLVRHWALLDRSAAASIAVWKALMASSVLSVVLVGIALASPKLPLTTSLAALLQACARALRASYTMPGGQATGALGAAAVAAVLVRAGWGVTSEMWSGRRARRQQAQALHLVATSQRRVGGAVQVHVDSAVPLVYCLPGRPGTVVFTSAALARLSDPQAAAVQAHELAHLRRRHHLVLAGARGLYRAFPYLPLFRAAPAELARLVEMDADDVAARTHNREALATALVQLAASPSLGGALGANGAATAIRVRRLARPPRRLDGPGRIVVAATVMGLVVAPTLLVALPGIGAWAAHLCPVPPWASPAS